MLKIIGLLFISHLSFAGTPNSFVLPSKASIQIDGWKQDGKETDAQICRDFRLDKKQIRNIFTTYKAVTAKELHDYYDWLPCFIEGKISYHSKMYSFKIRAGNILHTDFPDGVFRNLAGKRTTSP